MSNREDVERVITWLNHKPQEDILQFSDIKKYLSQHKVYVSLTTSPVRIKFLTYVLRTLDLSNVEKIVLSLPKRYGRDGSTYQLPNSLAKFPKLHINWLSEDHGPISKLVPAVQYALDVHKAEPDQGRGAIIIIIDDDTGYPKGMVNEIIKHLVNSKKTVVASSTQPLAFWNLDSSHWPDKRNDLVVEGMGGVGFKAGDVDFKKMLEVSRRQIAERGEKSCYLSDDMVISYVLALSGVDRRRIRNDHLNRDHIVQFPFGFGEDALHRGAGDKKLEEAKFVQANAVKYKSCYDFMKQAFR